MKRITFAPGGTPGLRISRPGFDVDAEALNSQGIAFDSRLGYIGGAWKTGITNLDTAVPYPFVPAVLPHLFIYCVRGDSWLLRDLRYIWTATGQNIAKPCMVGKLFSDHFIITTLSVPYYTVDHAAVAAFQFAYVLVKADV